ncbi:MAG: hypothetical protein WC679_00355 [Bacteroidales bacterium]|jgi:hypothetical protein
MFLSIVGFIVCIVASGMITATWFACGVFGFFGEYTIGGVPVKSRDRILYTALIIPIGFLWYGVYSIAPFTVTLV